MFLHQRIEVLIGLLQRASIVWSAKQAANAVGVEALTQPFGKRLRQAFQDLADAKPCVNNPRIVSIVPSPPPYMRICAPERALPIALA